MPHSTCLLPEGSFDTHVHVFDPNVGPYDGSRAYTPPDAPLKDLVDFSSKLNSSDSPLNLILVQPSPYGTDNHVLLQSLRQLQKNPKIVVRGIAVVDVLQVTDVDLVQMHQVGVRGLRLNLQSAGKGVNLEQLKLTLLTASQKIQHLPGWRLQVFAPAAVWSELYDFILQSPVEIIVDHIGGLLGASKIASGNADPNVALSQAGFDSLVKLARGRRVWIKVSGLYRASLRTDSCYDDLEGIVRRLFHEVPERLIWASDWPHTGEGKARAGKDKAARLAEIEEFRTIDNAKILQSLRNWSESEDTWKKIMVDNPRELFASPR